MKISSSLVSFFKFTLRVPSSREDPSLASIAQNHSQVVKFAFRVCCILCSPRTTYDFIASCKSQVIQGHRNCSRAPSSLCPKVYPSKEAAFLWCFERVLCRWYVIGCKPANNFSRTYPGSDKEASQNFTIQLKASISLLP